MHALDFLILPIGSAGDVYPLVGLGASLRDRGHHVTVLTSGYFRKTVEREALDFVDVFSEQDFLQLADDPELWHPRKGFGAIFRRSIAPHLREQYQHIVDRRTDRTVVITSVLGLGARMAHDHLGLPLVTVNLQPAVLWSRYQSPALYGVLPWAPGWLRQLMFKTGERLVLDRMVAPVINPWRAELGLAPMRELASWWNSPECILCLFPEWYAPRQPDWPSHVRFADFPLWNEQAQSPLPEEVERFLQQGTKPLVFTPGSANMFGEDFFRVSAAACAALGRRGMLMSRFEHHIPATLPEGVRHFPYAPFQTLLPRAAAMVHHGGIGTTAQALAAGIPQLIRPLSHDQPDNAQRVKQLGVGTLIPVKRYGHQRVATALSRLFQSHDVAAACERVAARISNVDNVYAAAGDICVSYGVSKCGLG